MKKQTRIHYMILPTKHVPLTKTLIGMGADILSRLDHPITISKLWYTVSEIPEIGTFGRFTMILDFLFLLGLVEYSQDKLRRVHQ